MIDESRACPSFSLTCAYTTLPGPWDDTYQCVPANSDAWLNTSDETAPYYAVFDGRTNC
jgi:hypothetical protein